ncbi:MAG: flagellar biosynthesis anti-sigma factor FlgM [Sphingomonas taxi]|uniref:Negative regulator of flagellin synthesis n=1 Tax=Sphingomonas taxi TaxID=1549858 RepID=A0A2W5P8D6_9SPHN|nr:MAG: flagellar biosynthesis anti-sigma factor FlgM [Sphingomonas taxi]
MVETIGSSTIKASDLRIASVQRPLAPTPVTDLAVTSKANAPATAPATLATSMAASAPVDTNRVEQIKSAIANGTFPLSPATIADQFIALKLNWMTPNEKA